ncbi:MAG TPA: c-type cytochrome [Gemmatimonadaceae bacterium]|nr:c-type cytochrome [Gemmatimonadaceae bacterium]
MAIAVPTDSESIAEGKRLAQLRGCSGGCHGTVTEGHVFFDDFLLGRLVAPNLTIAVREYSAPELARIIRRGVRPNGRSVVGMPSAILSQLNDEDLGRIIAYLRSVPPATGPARRLSPGPAGRLRFASGQSVLTTAGVRRAEALSDSFPRAGDPNAQGAYLARTVCTECHGLNLAGRNGRPDLRIAAGYTFEQFSHLMRTGEALGNREPQDDEPNGAQQVQPFHRRRGAGALRLPRRTCGPPPGGVAPLSPAWVAYLPVRRARYNSRFMGDQ